MTLRLALLCVWCVSCSCVDTFKEGWEYFHQSVRQSVSPHSLDPVPEPPLLPLTWDETIATEATRIAEFCEYYPSTSEYGQSSSWYSANRPSYANKAGCSTTTGCPVGEEWWSQRDNYDYATNQCNNFDAEGTQTARCSHYTQLVWNNSTKYGCGYAHCNHHYKGHWYVCLYWPAGNVGGMWPYMTADPTAITPAAPSPDTHSIDTEYSGEVQPNYYAAAASPLSDTPMATRLLLTKRVQWLLGSSAALLCISVVAYFLYGRANRPEFESMPDM
eukprot:NODE_3444_length_893_cov_77.627937_g3422_i0.p1 GENE.NODE_3444_length_893_cov_77.627937_g3422_i0~~NODE_3444_length_893_cov_77.627937_g3422_i0.p1  ORF type:complete len:291 (-),score=39.48 NODE_3444_length_893_cov_77.627937_g3422_i0:21-842(-)